MSIDDRIRWDRKHSAAGDPAEPEPSLDWVPRASADGACALDLACGRGRHVPALLERGYRVVAADISREGLRHIAGRAPGRVLDRVQFDADAWPFADAAFDLIVQTDFLDRALLPEIMASTKPGGLVLIDTFAGQRNEGGGGPANPAFRLRAGELRERFSDWETIRFAASADREAILVRAPR